MIRARTYMAPFLWIFLCVAGGAIVGILTAGGDSEWYQALNKPSWTPPAWVFPPVWTTLYAMMGMAGWLVWRQGGWRKQSLALNLFFVQLALNYAWSFIFFTAQRLEWALIEIIVLLIVIIITMWQFRKVDNRAGWLFVPYCLWVSYASALTAAIVFMQ